MENESSPITITFEIERSDLINKVFIGYETTDGAEHILASAAPPVSSELWGSPALPEEET